MAVPPSPFLSRTALCLFSLGKQHAGFLLLFLESRKGAQGLPDEADVYVTFLVYTVATGEGFTLFWRLSCMREVDS